MSQNRIFNNSLSILGDLKEELDKEKESQYAIKRKIEEETKTTGKVKIYMRM